MSRSARRVGMGVLFYPRGGSSQVARYLSLALADVGWEVSLACGSLGEPGAPTNAATFHQGLAVTAADYGPAVEAFAAGRDPLREPIPMHPSFEDGSDVADRVFAAVSPEIGDHLATAWEGILADAWAKAGLAHLHHLTPIHAAVRRLWPDRPVLTHLHGTELKMLDRIKRLEQLAGALKTDLAGMADRAGGIPTAMLDGLSREQRQLFEDTDWPRWRFGTHWFELLGGLARRSERLVAISDHDRHEALRLLGIEEERIEVVPNGVDTKRFDRRATTPEERLARWRRWLVTEPRGWDESGEPGSIRYEEADLDVFVDRETGDSATVLLYVGRFLDFKRVPMLVRAYARARPRFQRHAPLVIWGGSPGEWDGDHPHAVALREGEEGIFFVGWRGHDELPDGLACANVFVAPSTDEPFGLVLLEAMASGLPVIATRSGGPLSFVNTEPGRPNGWLVEPDDVDALADALVDAVNDIEQTRDRGENAYGQIRGTYSWHVVAERIAATYEVLGG